MSKRANWPMCAPRSSPRCADPCTPASPACVDSRSLPLLSFGIQDCNSKMFITLFHETHSRPSHPIAARQSFTIPKAGIKNRLATISIGDVASAEPLQDLALEPAASLSSKLANVLGVHSAVDRQQKFRVVSARVEALIDKIEVDAVKAQLPKMLDGVN